MKHLFITVYDSDYDTPISKICGTTPPDLIISTSNSLRLVFKTDSLRTATGFKASWTIDEVQTTKSPNYPLTYPQNYWPEVCMYIRNHKKI